MMTTTNDHRSGQRKMYIKSYFQSFVATVRSCCFLLIFLSKTQCQSNCNSYDVNIFGQQEDIHRSWIHNFVSPHFMLWLIWFWCCDFLICIYGHRWSYVCFYVCMRRCIISQKWWEWFLFHFLISNLMGCWLLF